MTQIVTALFDTYDNASEAVRRLETAGVSYRDISIVSNAKDARHLVQHGTTDDASKGTTAGIALGAALGGGAGLLAGLGLVVIPGLGPMVAAGWLAATMAGAAVGASTAGIAGALIAAGLSNEDAEIYAEGLGRGGTIVTARIEEDKVSLTRSILAESNGVDIRGSGDRHDAPGLHRPNEMTSPRPQSAAKISGDTTKVSATLIESDRVRGTSVYDRNGKHIGAVERMMIDKASGQVAHVVLAFGGFLGAGTDAETIPWDVLEYDTNLGGYRTSLTEDQVQGRHP
jgi:sporulation protein YlmC with PRC-barrel domain